MGMVGASVAASAACPTGAPTQRALNSGLMATGCTGCSCATGTAALTCSAQIYGYHDRRHCGDDVRGEHRGHAGRHAHLGAGVHHAELEYVHRVRVRHPCQRVRRRAQRDLHPRRHPHQGCAHLGFVDEVLRRSRRGRRLRDGTGVRAQAGGGRRRLPVDGRGAGLPDRAAAELVVHRVHGHAHLRGLQLRRAHRAATAGRC